MPYATAGLVQECPDEELLLQFDRGQLSEQDSSGIALHLSSCARCVETLDLLQSDDEDEYEDDPILACLKQCLRDPSPPVSPEYAEMEARAQALEQEAKLRRASAWDRGMGVDGNSVAGLRIGPYEVLSQIGRGGMGLVYLALQRPLQRKVAIKMILAGHHASPATVARFVREGKAVARLQHPNVVQVYELGESDGLPYMAMEYVEGGSLEAKLGVDAFEPRDAAALVVILAKAVESAHNQGVVHRDLKPANVLLAHDGTPKITDFGLAKLLDVDPNEEEGSQLVLTETDMILGTASYMAPEQAGGRSDAISRATDVYALGAILYALLTGYPPFQEKSKVQTLEKVRTAPPIPPSRLRHEVPYWLEVICLTCLEKSPQQRFPTAQVLADDLERWLRNERPQGTPSTMTRFTRTARKNLGKVLCSGALIFAVTGFAIRDPNHSLKQVERDLATGRTVTLIGKTGEPNWFQWRMGKSKGQHGLSDDRTWTISAWRNAIVELLPDPVSESYRIKMQVRHEDSDTGGAVGLYFARKDYRENDLIVNVFMKLSFNDARIEYAENLAVASKGLPYPRVPKDNLVHFAPHLIAEANGNERINLRMPDFKGPRFKPLGPNKRRWTDLEILVTPQKITAVWNGQMVTASPADVQRHIDASFAPTEPPIGPIPREFHPQFTTRGGLGLYVSKGSASFRSVTITPLKASAPSH